MGPMRNTNTPFSIASRQRVLAAMVLGTALTALGSATPASAQMPETTLQAINDMSRYCTVCWRNARLHPDNWTDCTQEVFARLLERIPTDAWNRVLQSDGEEHREFLRAIDTVKKRTQRSRKFAPILTEVVAQARDSYVADNREVVKQAAEELLSSRQQRILLLSIEGWSVHEIAEELSTPPERVSDEKYKAIRKLREHLCPEANG